jgi:hypothetical protein
MQQMCGVGTFIFSRFRVCRFSIRDCHLQRFRICATFYSECVKMRPMYAHAASDWYRLTVT